MEEFEQNAAIKYRRRGAIGTLTLSGGVDIFEAAPLLGAARRAAEDDAARTVRLDLRRAERLDLSALQILFALRRSLDAAGRAWEPDGASEALTASLTKIGAEL